jgi:hypothetical protein
MRRSYRPHEPTEHRPVERTPIERTTGCIGFPVGDPRAGARPRRGERLPAHTLAADRIELSASADLLAICGRGVCLPWLLGRWLDDARPAAALPSLRHVGPRFRARYLARGSAMVPAVALRMVAGDQYRPTRRLIRRVHPQAAQAQRVRPDRVHPYRVHPYRDHCASWSMRCGASRDPSSTAF